MAQRSQTQSLQDIAECLRELANIAAAIRERRE